MDARLYEAAMRGEVTLLLDLLQQENHALEGVTHDPITKENLLHVAAQFGHVDFAIEILSRKPEYAKELDSEGMSPLHLASGKGHLQMVKLLLEKDANVCFVRDKRRRTPLHIAARKGRADVLKELILAKPTAARIPTIQGETILHLCANNNQYEALKKLIMLVKDDDQLVNMKDENDNSILHLLARERQTEVIELFLSNPKLEINALNVSKYTPLDALLEAPRKSGYKKCRRILCRAGCKRAKKLPEAPDLSTYRRNSWKEHANWLHETKSTLMVVAILIATVTFGAVLNPPGGVWQDDYPPSFRPPDVNETDFEKWRNEIPYGEYRFAGNAIMSYENPALYLLISSFNQVGFLASVGIILLLISGFNLQRRSLMWALIIAMWIAIGSMVVTYGLAFIFITNVDSFHDAGLDYLYFPLIILSGFGSLVLIGPLVVAHLVRLVIRSVKKSRRASSSDGVAV